VCDVDSEGQFDGFLEEWSRREFLRALGGVLASSAFVAGGTTLLDSCGGDTKSSGATNAVRGGHLVEGTTSDISNINPIFSSDNISALIGGLVYSRLLTVDGAGNLLPDLAVEVPKVDPDQVTYRVRLREARWSDGRPVTADDVVLTYKLMSDPRYKAVTSRFRSQLERYLVSVTATDSGTIVFKTTTPYAPFGTSFMNIGILPAHVWGAMAPAELNASPLNQVPKVGSGVMLPVAWDKGSRYQMKRNDLYWRGKAYLDGYVMKVVADSGRIADQLKTGEIDVGQPDLGQWDSLAEVGSIARVSYVRPAFDYYVHNLDPAKTTRAAIFGDVQVRRALLTAIDRGQLADKVYFGLAAPADSSVSGAQWVHSTPRTQYPFSIAKAEQMLDAAGWVKGSDGIRARNGVRMEWELRTNAGSKVRETLVSVLAYQWSQIGAEVTTKLIPLPQLVSQLTQTRDFDMILFGINEGLDPDGTQLWGSKAIGNGALNGAAYKNRKVDDLLAEAVQTLEHEKRKALYQQIQEVLMEDLPAPLITYPKGAWGISKRVRNFRVAPWNELLSRPWFKDVYVTDGR
jgi:peptide/nickel transport system substrate-binding protein